MRVCVRAWIRSHENKAAFDGGPIADLGQDDVGASTVLEAKLLELQGHLDSTSPTMRARASPSPSRSPDLRATASGGDNNDDDNCDFDDDAHEEDVRELLASISAKALKVAGNRSTEKSMLGETIATARATAMKLEEVQVQPELAEVRAMEIELATELNLNRYQDCIEERRAALFSTSGIDPAREQRVVGTRWIASLSRRKPRWALRTAVGAAPSSWSRKMAAERPHKEIWSTRAGKW